MNRRWIIWSILVLMLVSGCANRHLKEYSEQGTLVYGYLDMEEAPVHTLDDFVLKQALPKIDDPYRHMHTSEGVFYMENLPPGSYQMSSFSAKGIWFFFGQNYYWFTFPAQTEGFRITQPGLYYLGSYKYKKAGTFWIPKFEIERIDSPGERDALSKIIQYGKGTKWESLIQKRIDELGGGK